jgi:adenylylsulfate kinase
LLTTDLRSETVRRRSAISTWRRSIPEPLVWGVVAGFTAGAIVLYAIGSLPLAGTTAGAETLLLTAFGWLRARGRAAASTAATPSGVVWFTGLSGAGKSTISNRVYDELKRRGWRVEHLDGDAVRAVFPSTGFTRPERDAHIRRIGYLARKLEENGVFVLASFVSPYRDSRLFVRSVCDTFIEVHVSAPIEVCEGRDVKGLYARARRGEIRNFTGIDDPYEPPVAPELTIDTASISVDDAVSRVLVAIEHRVGEVNCT